MWPVQCRKIIMEALFLFNVREMIVQSFVNYLSDISSRHFSFLKVDIFFWKRRSQIILASFDIQLNSKKKSRKIDISFSFFEKSWGKKSKIFLTTKNYFVPKREKNWSCVILLFKVLQTTFVMGYYGDKSFYEVHEIGKTTLFVEACKSY